MKLTQPSKQPETEARERVRLFSDLRPSGSVRSVSPTLQRVLLLQRLAGNQAVNALLSRSNVWSPVDALGANLTVQRGRSKHDKEVYQKERAEKRIAHSAQTAETEQQIVIQGWLLDHLSQDIQTQYQAWVEVCRVNGLCVGWTFMHQFYPERTAVVWDKASERREDVNPEDIVFVLTRAFEFFRQQSEETRREADYGCAYPEKTAVESEVESKLGEADRLSLQHRKVVLKCYRERAGAELLHEIQKLIPKVRYSFVRVETKDHSFSLECDYVNGRVRFTGIMEGVSGDFYTNVQAVPPQEIARRFDRALPFENWGDKKNREVDIEIYKGAE